MKVSHSRAFKRNELTGEWKADVLPTVTVKKGVIQTTISPNSMRSSHTCSGTAPLRLTRLHLFSNKECQYALVDRDGTFDVYDVGTALYGQNRQHDLLIQGRPDAPIVTCKGTFAVYTGAGQGSHAGSFVIAWEGVQ